MEVLHRVGDVSGSLFALVLHSRGHRTNMLNVGKEIVNSQCAVTVKILTRFSRVAYFLLFEIESHPLAKRKTNNRERLHQLTFI